jgi:adenylate cyclase
MPKGEGMDRKLTAILYADVAGYSRLTGLDEEGTHQTLKAHLGLLTETIQNHDGRICHFAGDAVLAEFASVVTAVGCAVAAQRALAERNKNLPESRKLQFRIGVNLGDVMVDGEEIYGNGVNVAARLETLAEAGGICISGRVFDQVEKNVNVGFASLGPQTVKNIERPVNAYKVLLDPEDAGKVIGVTRSAIPQGRGGVVALGALVLLVGVAGVLGWSYLGRPDVEPASIAEMAFSLPERPSIAVLPLDNLSADPEQDFLADGLTEEIITTLSKVPDLFVIARHSTDTYKGKSVPIKQVAEEQGVRYVLEGSVQRSGDRIRINAQLTDALEGKHLWAERYDREFRDLFELQDDITSNVAIALQIQLTVGKMGKFRRKGTTNAEAEAFLLAHKAAWYHRRFNKEDNATAQELLQQAREIDPDALWPLQMEGWIHIQQSRFGWSPSREESLRRAEEIAEQALAIDDADTWTHALLASVARARGDLDQSIHHNQRAIELAPNNNIAIGGRAQLLNYAGRPEEAIPYSKRAMRLSPVHPPWMPANLGLSYMMIGEYDKAIAAYEEVLARGAMTVFATERLTAICALKGDLDRAKEYAAKLLELKPDFTIEGWSKALFYKEQADLDRELNALRKAGLPE